MSIFFPNFSPQAPLNMSAKGMNPTLSPLIGQCPNCHYSIPQCRCVAVVQTPAPKQHVEPLKPDSLDAITSLDELWAIASGFGRVELGQNVGIIAEAPITHKAAIAFDTKAGSHVCARGAGITAQDAMRKAIKEAAALQCGVEFANS